LAHGENVAQSSICATTEIDLVLATPSNRL